MSKWNDAGKLAENDADQASPAASKLKLGTWEAVQALATLYIAQSLLSQGSASLSNA